MNKIFIVAGREFFTRIQSRTFIVMSILGPLLFGLFVLVPVLMAKWNNDSTTVWVHDPSGQLSDAFQDQNGLKFQVLPQGTLSNGVLVPADSANIRELLEDQDAGLLHLQAPDSNLNVEARYYSAQAAGLKITERIQSALNDRLYRLRMERQGLDPKVIESLRAEVQLQTSVWTDQGSEDSHTETAMLLGFGAALLMYMFIFMYGSMVMRGVIEEKASRVMELLVSTTKPFELMMGKILGIASVGLFQFVLWLLLGTAISTAIGAMGLGTAPGTASVASTTTGTASGPWHGYGPWHGQQPPSRCPSRLDANSRANAMGNHHPLLSVLFFGRVFLLRGPFCSRWIRRGLRRRLPTAHAPHQPPHHFVLCCIAICYAEPPRQPGLLDEYDSTDLPGGHGCPFAVWSPRLGIGPLDVFAGGRFCRGGMAGRSDIPNWGLDVRPKSLL